MSSSDTSKDIHSFVVVNPAFSLPTTVSPTLQSALKGGFGEAVVACDMPELCKFPFLDSCQKRFLWTHKEVNLALHPVVGLVLHPSRRCEEVSSCTRSMILLGRPTRLMVG